jgi:hypothetical protein
MRSMSSRGQPRLLNFQLSTRTVFKEVAGVVADVSCRNLRGCILRGLLKPPAMDTGTKGIDERPHTLTGCSLFTVCELHVGLPRLQ